MIRFGFGKDRTREDKRDAEGQLSREDIASLLKGRASRGVSSELAQKARENRRQAVRAVLLRTHQ